MYSEGLSSQPSSTVIAQGIKRDLGLCLVCGTGGVEGTADSVWKVAQWRCEGVRVESTRF